MSTSSAWVPKNVGDVGHAQSTWSSGTVAHLWSVRTRSSAERRLASGAYCERPPLSLVDFRGNFGSLNDPAARPATEARLSPFGALSLAAEGGEIGPVPIG